MNWDAAGAIGEIVGAIAVVFSIIYLATQIKQSNRESQATSRDNISKAISDIMVNIAADPDMSEILGQGLKDITTLSDLEVRRFDMLLYAIFECLESAHSQWKRGVLADDDWHKWSSTIGTFMGQPGCQSFWVRASGNFAPSFIDYVENVPRNTNYSWDIAETVKSDSDTAA